MGVNLSGFCNSEIVTNTQAVIVGVIEVQIGGVNEGAFGQGITRFSQSIGEFLSAPFILGIACHIQREGGQAEGALTSERKTAAYSIAVDVDGVVVEVATVNWPILYLPPSEKFVLES